MSLLDELKRRNVIRVGIAYLAVSWLLIQIAETLLPYYGYTDVAIRNLVAILVVGLVPVLILAGTSCVRNTAIWISRLKILK